MKDEQKRELREYLKEHLTDHSMLMFLKSYYNVNDSSIDFDKMLVENPNFQDEQDDYWVQFHVNNHNDSKQTLTIPERPYKEEDDLWRLELKDPVVYNNQTFSASEFREKIVDEMINEFLITDKQSGQHNVNEFLKNRLSSDGWDHKMVLISDENKRFEFNIKPYKDAPNQQEYKERLHKVRNNTKDWWDEMILKYDEYKKQLDKGMQDVDDRFKKTNNKLSKGFWFQSLLTNKWIMLAMIITGFPIVAAGMLGVLGLNFIRKRMIQGKVKKIQEEYKHLKQNKEESTKFFNSYQKQQFKEIRNDQSVVNKIDHDSFVHDLEELKKQHKDKGRKPDGPGGRDR